MKVEEVFISKRALIREVVVTIQWGQADVRDNQYWKQHSYYRVYSCSEYCGFLLLKLRTDCIHVQLDVIYTVY